MLPVQSPPDVDRIGALLDDLVARGWSVQPRFFPADLTATLLDELRALEAADSLRRAGVGRDEDYRLDAHTRGDRIRWLDGGTPAQRDYLARMEALRVEINGALFLGLFDFESHFALYPPGARYARHRDNFVGGGPRKLSTVSYLKPSWRTGDGGLLRIYDPRDEDRLLVEVEPRAGTLACFLSEEFPHEVTPAVAPRASVVGWFRIRAEGPW